MSSEESSEKSQAEGCLWWKPTPCSFGGCACLKIHCLVSRLGSKMCTVLSCGRWCWPPWSMAKQLNPPFFFLQLLLLYYNEALFLSRDSNCCCSHLQYDGRAHKKNQPLCLIHQPRFLSIVASVRDAIRLECRLVQPSKQPSMHFHQPHSSTELSSTFISIFPCSGSNLHMQYWLTWEIESEKKRK